MQVAVAEEEARELEEAVAAASAAAALNEAPRVAADPGAWAAEEVAAARAQGLDPGTLVKRKKERVKYWRKRASHMETEAAAAVPGHQANLLPDAMAAAQAQVLRPSPNFAVWAVHHAHVTLSYHHPFGYFEHGCNDKKRAPKAAAMKPVDELLCQILAENEYS